MKRKLSKRRHIINKLDIEDSNIPKEERDIIAKTMEINSHCLNSDLLYSPNKFEQTDENLKLLNYIFDKTQRSQFDILFLSYYLISFKEFTQSILEKTTKTDISFFVKKIAKYIKREQYKKNDIICRLGEMGDKFYLILNGKVGVLLKKEKDAYLTKDQYIQHLIKLNALNEYELFDLTFKSNFKVNRKWGIWRNDFENNDYINNIKKSNDLKYESLEEYLHLISTPETIEVNNKNTSMLREENVHLYIYYTVCFLSNGKKFGELALRLNETKRTATIYCIDNISVAVLSKKKYEMSFKEILEKNRKEEVSFLINTDIFQGQNISTFESKLFNNFAKIDIERHQYIFKEGDKRTKIYFIKSGEFEIKTKCTFSFLEHLIVKLGYVLKDKNEFDNPLININDYMDNLNKKLFNIRIIVIKGGDIIGLDDYIYEGKFFCSCQCLTERGELYEIESQRLFELVKKDWRIIKNINEFKEKKRLFISKRLNDIRQVQFQKYEKGLLYKIKGLSYDDNIKYCYYNSPYSHIETHKKGKKCIEIPIVERRSNKSINFNLSQLKLKTTNDFYSNKSYDNNNNNNNSDVNLSNIKGKGKGKFLILNEINEEGKLILSKLRKSKYYLDTYNNDVMFKKRIRFTQISNEIRKKNDLTKRKVQFSLLKEFQKYSNINIKPNTTKLKEEKIRNLVLDPYSDIILTNGNRNDNTIDFLAFDKKVESISPKIEKVWSPKRMHYYIKRSFTSYKKK